LLRSPIGDKNVGGAEVSGDPRLQILFARALEGHGEVTGVKEQTIGFNASERRVGHGFCDLAPALGRDASFKRVAIDFGSGIDRDV
jgi:hypothetical protein